MLTIRVNVAVVMLKTWPRCLDFVDLDSEYTLSITVSMNRRDLSLNVEFKSLWWDGPDAYMSAMN